MTILICDDEQAVRDYLGTALDWTALGYEFYEAGNGKTAVEIMEQRQIDLAIIDITMPVMNGIEVMEWVRKKHYSCVLSFLTCHDEFDFALKALKTGCFDYILKNEITDDKILELVTKMSNTASEEARRKQHYTVLETAARRDEQQEIRSRISYWLNHLPESVEGMEEFFKTKMGFHKEQQNFVLLMVHIEDYQQTVRRYTNNDNVHFLAILYNILGELFGQYRFLILPKEEGIFYIFLAADKKIHLHDIVGDICKAAITLGGRPLQIQSRVLYSLPYSDMAESHLLYHKMKELEALAFYPLAENTLCVRDFITEEAECTACLKGFEKKFRAELENRNMAQIEICYDTMIAEIVKNLYNIFPDKFIHVCESCMYGFFLQSSSSEPAEAADLPLKYKNSGEYKEHILEALHSYCIPDVTQDKNKLIKKAILMIQQNYSEEDMGLDWLAQKLWVNASYLSRLFSQEVGQSLTAYISCYRIEQAKKMIKTSLKLYEIAEKTGFSSPIVFSSVFKKVTGETPTEYRNRNV